MTTRCDKSNYTDKRTNIGYCQHCQNNVNADLATPLALNRTATNMALQNLSDDPEISIDLRRIIEELYREEEVLGKDQLFWGVRKHLAACRSVDRAREYIDLRHQLHKRAFVRINEQKIDSVIARDQAQINAEITRNQARVSDAIREEQLWNRMELLTHILSNLGKPLPDNIVENLTDDGKADLTSSVLEKLLDYVFSVDTPAQPNSDPGISRHQVRSQRLIDADEF